MEQPPLPNNSVNCDGQDALAAFKDDLHLPSNGPAGRGHRSGESAAPLTEDDFALIRQATGRRKAIRKAAKVAKRSATTTLVIGALAVPFVLLSFSLSGLVMAAGLIVVGSIENRGHRMLLRADPAGPKLLARNQLAFLGLIVVYCVWQIIAAGTVEAVSPSSALSSATCPATRTWSTTSRSSTPASFAASTPSSSS